MPTEYLGGSLRAGGCQLQEMAETCRARLVEAVLLSLLASDTQDPSP